MCVNYLPPSQEQFERFDVQPPAIGIWPTEIWQDYAAPIIRTNREGRREAVVATFGMIPKNRIPSGVKKYSTMNTRAESVGSLRSYSKAWKTSQLCLVPMQCFYEPNWETGKHIRWRIAMQDGSPFAVAGLWREWPEENGQVSYSFTQLTVNADDHEVMKHFHRPGEEKRSLVIIPASEYDDWLNCRNPEVARTYMSLYPEELMASAPAPNTAGNRGTATEIL